MLIAAIILATTVTAASAQSNSLPILRDPPTTITYTNKATGEKIGTATISGNWVFLRDKHGEHYATIITEHGVRRWVDPSGNPIDPKTTLLPLE
jgi:hypothetical protein